MREVLGIMIAKGASTRLEAKNRRLFHGRPMFLWNLEKLLRELPEVVFESDDASLLALAAEAGAIPMLRPESLRGNEVPSVPLFQNIVRQRPRRPDAVLNVQANSPTTTPKTIRAAVHVMQHTACNELQTVFPVTHTQNGSLWGFGIDRLVNYGDPYVHHPDVLLVDDAIDIHTSEEFERALVQRPLV